MAEVTLFPEQLLDLQRELLHPFHADLHKQLNSKARPFDEILQDICTYLLIGLEGVYSRQDQLDIAARCAIELRKRRNDAAQNQIGIRLN